LYLLLLAGWKFWVPAASLNFYAVPLKQQVLYMSCCGMLWTAYLSYISTVSVKQQQQQQAQPVLAATGKGSKRK
jgi:protein Mpv17